MKSFRLPGLPDDLRSLRSADSEVDLDGGTVTIRAAAGDDLFNRPGTELTLHSANVFAFPVDGDFTLEAEVEVDFREGFDSAVLVGYLDGLHWFKLCAEQDELGRPRIMSVVTRDRSDDATGIHLPEGPVRLRMSRVGTMISLHYRADGRWELARYFGFPVSGAEGGLKAGLAVQSPRGNGTTATFRDVVFATSGIMEVRSGD
ncbi:DUF1349 domain-containing protein [Arthrobacter sp. NPDC090010]|uniref:DUF1349 domain-containing protein n=1 Tax=Arthrobacter sp. NPDC090010 TaxID=3363942 RepID=UPI00382CFD34